MDPHLLPIPKCQALSLTPKQGGLLWNDLMAPIVWLAVPLTALATILSICWVFPLLPVGFCVPLTALELQFYLSVEYFPFFLWGFVCLCLWPHVCLCLWPQFYLSVEYFPFFLWGFVCLWQLCVPLTVLELQFYLLSISLLPVGLCVSLSLTTILPICWVLPFLPLGLCVPLTALCATNSSRVAILSAISLLPVGLCVSLSLTTILSICWVLPFLPLGLCVPLTALCATNSSRVAILFAEYFPYFLWGFVCCRQL